MANPLAAVRKDIFNKQKHSRKAVQKKQEGKTKSSSPPVKIISKNSKKSNCLLAIKTSLVPIQPLKG